ncbi:MAG: rod shape-determining protein MreC [Acidobacteria bacterium]|nr:rod shape-determining protein MreC [Acidobacteriota bacterium]
MTSSHRNLLILAAVLLAQLLLLAYQLRRDQNVPLIRHGAVRVVAPIQKAFHAMAHGIGGLWGSYVELWHARRDNEDLLRELNRLKLDNHRLRSEAAQARRLQVLFDFQQETPFPMVAAQVIGSDTTQTSHLLLIDKGSTAGLRPDLPVLVPEGVVGKVLYVFPNAAQVLLLTDGNSGLGCLLEESRIHGVLKGKNQPLCELAYIANDENVEIGSRVLTSGEDKIYPKDLPVGVVVSAHPGTDFQRIEVQPFAELNRLEEVLIILPESSSERAESEREAQSGPSHKESRTTATSGLTTAPLPSPDALEPATSPTLPATSPSP